MNISIFLIGFVFMFGGLSVWILPTFKLGIFLLEWDFLSLKFNFYFNSILFSFILFLVTFSVLVFSTYYLNGELNFNYYYFVLLIFVGSMFSLNFSNSIFTMLLSWDLLGISSFFLVLFYNNWDSCSGAMNTALTNRLGDYFMFVFFGLSVFSGYYFLSFSMFSSYMALLLLLTAFTKSAQFPFSSWLPKAMSAPTPVSSLVHSSTLVTAGLILLMNFNNLVLQKNFISFVLIIGLFTMFFSSLASLVEEDLKKVVALSTLSQMGFSMVTLGLGLSFISFIHLVSHALFKSCLFMQVGYIIHCSFGQQDGRNYSNNGNLPNFIQIQMLVTLFCLCGLIFSSGAVSKDFILELFFSNNYMLFFSLMFFVSVFLTFGYSYRLWKSFFLSFNKVMNHYSSSVFMNFLSLALVIFSISFLWWLNFNLLNVPSLFLYVDFFGPLVFLFMMIFLSFLVLKMLFKELVYKFLVDYLAKNSIYKMKNIKFMDLFLNNINSKGYSLFLGSGMFKNYYLKSLNFNSVVVLIFIFFMIC
uniref:NADH:ubiquinone reductase (H(+)-translocating) n=1 Tax=Caenorhabditis nouraguensis TaxID=1094327 RepID=A0A1Z1GDI1_9PELO|nr:NADH dehydrogenase subunit 5 [Caenorhabditis nouraguensis]ARV88329.1 NADH dehydrogenase subunit 5 [Caenorhabditis nouraguensis]